MVVLRDVTTNANVPEIGAGKLMKTKLDTVKKSPLAPGGGMEEGMSKANGLECERVIVNEIACTEAQKLATENAQRAEPNSPPRFKFDVDAPKNRGLGETYEYTPYVAKYHNEQELKGRPSPNAFTDIQVDVKPRMRTILFTWLVDVHRKFQLVDEVLWRTFEILDRYLAVKKECRKNLQRLACAALWIASKYHEIYPPTAEDLVTVSDKAFTKAALLKMELQLCRHFGMKFTYPTAFNFLQRYTDVALANIKVAPEKAEKVKKRIKYLSMYGMERMTMEIRVLQYKPSLLAACSLFTAMTLISQPWTDELTEATGYSDVEFREKYDLYRRIKRHVMDFQSKNHNAVIRKYSTAERGEVSSLRKKANPAARQAPRQNRALKRTHSQMTPEGPNRRSNPSGQGQPRDRKRVKRC